MTYRLLFTNGSGRRFNAASDAEAIARSERISKATHKPRWSLREVQPGHMSGRLVEKRGVR